MAIDKVRKLRLINQMRNVSTPPKETSIEPEKQ